MIYRYTVICLMALIILFVIHLLIIKLYNVEGLAQPQQFVESNLIQGLYSTNDKVVILTADNFDQNVYNSSSAWLVQFYNSWCGHCMKFSPIWKQFGADIHNWRSVVKVGVINCAADENTQHCREYDIMGYPTFRFFQPHTANFTVAKDFIPSSRDDAEKIRHDLLVYLETASLEVPVGTFPLLSSIRKHDIDLIVEEPKTSEFLLIVEEGQSFVGRDLIMDLSSLTWLTVRRILRQDYPTKEAFHLFTITKSKNAIPIAVNGMSRSGVFESVRGFFLAKGYIIGELFLKKEVMVDKDSHRKSTVQTLKRKAMVHMVFQTDLETALAFSLSHEVTLKAHIEGDAFVALMNYLLVVSKYFPFNSSSEAFTRSLVQELSKHSEISGEELKRLVDGHGKEFLQKPREWIGCGGSESKYRGYTCGLWMMFHTMTVRKYATGNATPATEVLAAITGYVRNFFGCMECSEHFLEMSKTIEGNVTSISDDVMWLWKAHNVVNRRLAGDKTEDPAFPKQQFPHQDACGPCRQSDSKWNETNVLKYLVNMYSHVQPRQKNNSLVSEKMVVDEEQRYVAHKEHGWNFSLTDVNTCIGLYVLSACLLTVYTVRLFMKRSPRAVRHYKYDFSSKA